jgi:glycine betaine/proline transport system substrate-binding protein
MHIRNIARPLLVSSLVLSLGLAAHAAPDLPGKGVKVLPLQSALVEETFQTLLVTRALQKLGYDVQPIKED